MVDKEQDPYTIPRVRGSCRGTRLPVVAMPRGGPTRPFGQPPVGAKEVRMQFRHSPPYRKTTQTRVCARVIVTTPSRGYKIRTKERKVTAMKTDAMMA